MTLLNDVMIKHISVTGIQLSLIEVMDHAGLEPTTARL